ncbi:MAG: hypothetical protein KGH63_01555 [Candidatus Micrarchaeota archaeon]|nr:hypothetical protein [Candidatus Micrarchaeota archaeon]
MAAQSKEAKSKATPSPGSAKPASGPAPSKPSAGLSSNQKYALIGGAIVIAIVLGLALFSSPGTDPKEFTNYLYSNPQSGIVMDVRNSPSQNATTKILQCGVNLISSGFYAKTGKSLLVYACDSTGCLSADSNATNASAINASALISYSDALYAMRGRAYFDIAYGAQAHYVFHPTYAEVFINENSDPAACSIGVQTAPKN